MGNDIMEIDPKYEFLSDSFTSIEMLVKLGQNRKKSWKSLKQTSRTPFIPQVYWGTTDK